jgi:hypothetical protein
MNLSFLSKKITILVELVNFVLVALGSSHLGLRILLFLVLRLLAALLLLVR